MNDNVVFVDFGLSSAESTHEMAKVAAPAVGSDLSDGAQTLVWNVGHAQTSVGDMTAQTDTLIQKTQAMVGASQSLRSAMAELDRAYDQLGSLSKKAREIASYSV